MDRILNRPGGLPSALDSTDEPSQTMPRRSGEVISLMAYQAATEVPRHSPLPATVDSERVFRFDCFQVHPGQRTLMEDGRLVRVGSRAFDLLVELCRRAGDVVSNRELLAAAWPNRVVDEGSVRVHIASLRKALGDGVGDRRYVTNVPLRGYCFVAPVEATAAAVPTRPVAPESVAASLSEVSHERGQWRLPHTNALVGRDGEAAELLEELRRHRCVTLVGPGGIGKTSVALPVARQFGELEDSDVVLVELASLSRSELVPVAIASALGVVVPEYQPLPAIAAFIRGQNRLLILLDNCEHVIDGVASAAEHILAHAPNVRLLATSRESLRIQGEWVQRLESLTLPPPAMQGRAEDALKYSAVQLFVERAAAGSSTFEMGDEESPLVCSICRRLDGIPLAIELAAGAIDAVGLKLLVERLGSRLGSRLVVGRGRRTASPRHQTLRATLDWSHDLMPTEEQELLAHLSVFRGVFTHAAAQTIFDRPAEILDVCLASLVSKSMVVSERKGDTVVYRLLETTREYAAERLASSGASAVVARRHAQYMLNLVRSEEQALEDRLGSQRSATSSRWVDDLRESAAWAFSSEPTRHLGVSIVAWSAPLWFSLSMLAEYRKLAETALEVIDAGSEGDFDSEEEMRLCEAMGHAMWHTQGGGKAMVAAFNRALAIAERLNATTYRLRCRWGLWLACNAEGDYEGSRSLAEQFGEIVASLDDPAVQLTYERMMALGTHFQGDQTQGRHFAQRVLDKSGFREPSARRGGFQFDQRVAALTVMSRVLWLQGFPEQALAHAGEAVHEALTIDHALSLCYAIAIGAAPVAFWCGDRVQARDWSTLLTQSAGEHCLPFWLAFGAGYQLLNDTHDGTVASSLLGARAGLGTPVREILCSIDSRFLDDELVTRMKRGKAGWCAPELWRVDGERSRQAASWDDATKSFQRGIKLARQQQAAAWELRCSTSLARLLVERGRRAEARKVIEPVLNRFQEGHATQDLRVARELFEGEL